MSWDVTLFEVPAAIVSAAELPDDFNPRAFPRTELIAKIRSVFRDADFSDPSWGVVDGDGWSIEVNIGEELSHGPMLHVRGGEGAVDAVLRICDALSLRGFDCSSGEFLDKTQDPGAGLRAWSAYRDQVVEGTREPSFFSRLWRRFKRT